MKRKRKSNREIIRELKEKLQEREQTVSKVVEECAQLHEMHPDIVPFSSVELIHPKVKEALEYYAKPENWLIRGYPKRFMLVEQDKGNLAREALQCVK